MASGHLYATEYAQPRPVDGVYPATVFESHAEFHYMGRRVIAKSVKESMGAQGNPGMVFVKGFVVDISWSGIAPHREPVAARHIQMESSFEKVHIASLHPDFDQPHPFADNNLEFRSRTERINIHFGHYEKYSAVLDGNIQFAVVDAPCTIKPIESEPLKCLVIVDDATVFLAKRYGPGKHDQLVEKAVIDLQQFHSPK